jgi:hypothetical protein
MTLLETFGKKILEKRIDALEMKLYHIYDFYVEVFSHAGNNHVLRAEPVSSQRMKKFYFDVGISKTC